jgi:hypothetical protein
MDIAEQDVELKGSNKHQHHGVIEGSGIPG